MNLNLIEGGRAVANFFCSAGYGLESVHTGMVAYLCDLWGEGNEGMIRYLEEAAALSNASPTGQPDMERLAVLAKKYDIEFVSEPPGQGS